MKILVVLKRCRGGVGVVINTISKILEEEGHSVDVISREDDLKKYSLFKSFFFLRKTLKKLVKEKEYDIIYTQDWSLTLPMIFPYHLFKDKHFCCFHGNEEGISGFLQLMTGRIMKGNLISVGDPVKKKFPLSHLIYNGIDMKKFSPLNKKRTKVGYIGIEVTPYTLKKVGEFEKEFDMKASEAKGIPHEKMNEWYNSLKIFVSMPEPWVGFNMCWLEAMAAGVPIIIGNEAGIGKKLPITKNDETPARKDYRRWLDKHGEFDWKNNTLRLIKIFEGRK
jgi:glycosyltransferase involved in cell wall biosynthesis